MSENISLLLIGQVDSLLAYQEAISTQFTAYANTV